jgi:cystathionine beta-lyase
VGCRYGFKIADEIIEDITKAAEHGIYGYTYFYEELYNSLIQWNARRNNWHFSASDVVFYHGIVPSLNLIIQEFTNVGDEIIVQTLCIFLFLSRSKNILGLFSITNWFCVMECIK